MKLVIVTIDIRLIALAYITCIVAPILHISFVHPTSVVHGGDRRTCALMREHVFGKPPSWPCVSVPKRTHTFFCWHFHLPYARALEREHGEHLRRSAGKKVFSGANVCATVLACECVWLLRNQLQTHMPHYDNHICRVCVCVRARTRLPVYQNDRRILFFRQYFGE